MKIVVVGAGFGGLAAAIRLRVMGHDVTVLEKRDTPGGRAAVVRQDGFVFDIGPTIITAPQLIDELFALAGRTRDEYLPLAPLDPFYRVRFADGSAVSCSADDLEMERQVAALNPGDVAGYRRFRRIATAVFDRAMPLIDRPVQSVMDMVRLAPALVRTRAWRSVGTTVDRCVTDPRLRQLLSFHPLLIGGHPFHAPALYALIPELERRWGVWYAVGGTGALVSALVRLFTELGGEIRCDTEVDQILVDGDARAIGVRQNDGTSVAADAVVCNADPGWAHAHLLPRSLLRARTRRRLTRYRYGMSAFLLCFGTSRRYDDVAHHEILMSARYRELLDDIFRGARLAEDFSVYVHRPTATDASVAPVGCDAFYALVPVPHLGADIDWSASARGMRDRLVSLLEHRLLPGLARHIVTEHMIDPRYFRDELNSPLGSAFSIEPRLDQSAWFRPHNASDDVRNLYFVGAGTHPGAGIPGVLSSGKIAAQLIAGTDPATIRRSAPLSQAAAATS